MGMNILSIFLAAIDFKLGMKAKWSIQRTTINYKIGIGHFSHVDILKVDITRPVPLWICIVLMFSFIFGGELPTITSIMIYVCIMWRFDLISYLNNSRDVHIQENPGMVNNGQ